MASGRKKNRRFDKRTSLHTHTVSGGYRKPGRRGPVTPKTDKFVRPTRKPAFIDPNLAWYAIRTNIKCEGRAISGLKEAKIPAFMPTDIVLRKRRRGNTETTWQATVNAFPRYMFVGLDPNEPQFGFVRAVNGVENFVIGTSGAPFPIPAAVLHRIEKRLCAGDAITPDNPITVGSDYPVLDGPLEGHVIEVLKLIGGDQVIGRVNLFGGKTEARLPIAWLDVEGRAA